MKVLTKNTDYAIRALLALAAKKGSYRGCSGWLHDGEGSGYDQRNTID